MADVWECGVCTLQRPLIDLVMDVMVTACKNAKKIELDFTLPLHQSSRSALREYTWPRPLLIAVRFGVVHCRASHMVVSAL